MNTVFISDDWLDYYHQLPCIHIPC